jgi:hypothetical protein
VSDTEEELAVRQWKTRLEALRTLLKLRRAIWLMARIGKHRPASRARRHLALSIYDCILEDPDYIFEKEDP